MVFTLIAGGIQRATHQERRALAQPLRKVPGDHGQDNTQMIAKTHMPGRIVFQSPAACRLLFLFPSGKEGSIRPWKTDPIGKSGNEIHFLNSATQWLFENAVRFRLQE